MLRPIKKEKGITESEKHLVRLANKTFIGLWSYPNVYTDEGITKSKEGKELCDLLVVFGNKVIIFSDKDIKFNSEIPLETAWKRWLKRSVEKSSSQLFGAESWIKNFPERLYLDKKCKNKFPLKLDQDNLEIYLIAVTKNSTQPAEKYFSTVAENHARKTSQPIKCNGASSGTFIQAYNLTKDECLKLPFVITDFDTQRTFVHILDEITLDLLLSNLDTIYDFTHYLKVKQKSIRSKYLHSVLAEEDLLAHYLMNLNKSLVGDIPRLENHPEEHSISLPEGMWNDYCKSDLNLIFKSHRKQSKFWDYLISICSDSILKANVSFTAHFPFEAHERALNFLAAENRISRSVLTEAFMDKKNLVNSNMRSARLVFSPLHKETLYVFLFLPPINNLSKENYRLTRAALAKDYLIVAKYQHPKAKNVVVIATETKGADERSEDIIAAIYDSPLSSEEKKHAKELMDNKKILERSKGSTNKNIKHHSRPYLELTPKQGRNITCGCGSGKKYKKCCINRH